MALSTLDEVRCTAKGNQFTEDPPPCDCPACLFKALLETIAQQLDENGMAVVLIPVSDEQKGSWPA